MQIFIAQKRVAKSQYLKYDFEITPTDMRFLREIQKKNSHFRSIGNPCVTEMLHFQARKFENSKRFCDAFSYKKQ